MVKYKTLFAPFNNEIEVYEKNIYKYNILLSFFI